MDRLRGGPRGTGPQRGTNLRAPWRPAPRRTRSARPTPATTTWRRSTTTPSGASTTGSAASAQVTGKLRKAIGARTLGPYRARPGDRRRHRLLRAQPGALPAWSGELHRHRHLPRDARRAGGQRRAPGRAGAHGALRGAASCPFPDDSFDLVFGHAVLHHLPDLEASFREFLRVLRPGGTIAFCGEPSHLRRPDRLAAQARRLPRGAGLARHDPRARGRAQRPPPGARGGRPGADRGRARLHARRCCATAAAARVRPTSGCAARSWPPACSAGPTARSRPRPSPPTCRGCGASTPTAATWPSRPLDRPLLEPRLPAGAVLQPAGLGRGRRRRQRSPVAGVGQTASTTAGTVARSTQAQSTGRTRSASAAVGAPEKRPASAATQPSTASTSIGSGGGATPPSVIQRARRPAAARRPSEPIASSVRAASGTARQPAQPAERAARHLAQPRRARRRAQPGGHEHQQRRARARAAAPRRAPGRRRGEDQRAPASSRGEHQAGGHAPTRRGAQWPTPGPARRRMRPAAASPCPTAAARRLTAAASATARGSKRPGARSPRRRAARRAGLPPAGQSRSPRR